VVGYAAGSWQAKASIYSLPLNAPTGNALLKFSRSSHRQTQVNESIFQSYPIAGGGLSHPDLVLF